jgi:hypothetical protein
MSWTSLANRAYQVAANKNKGQQIVLGSITKSLGQFTDAILASKAEAKKVANESVNTAINQAGIPTSHIPELTEITAGWKKDAYKLSRRSNNKLLGQDKRQEATNRANEINQKAATLNQDIKLLQQTAKQALELELSGTESSNYSNAASEGLKTDLIKIAKGDWSSVGFKHPMTGEVGTFIQVGEDMEDPNSFVDFRKAANNIGLPKSQATRSHTEVVDIFAQAEKLKTEWNTERDGDWKTSGRRAALMQELRNAMKPTANDQKAGITSQDITGSLAYDFGLEDLGIDSTFINQYFKDTLTDEEFLGIYSDVSDENQEAFTEFEDTKKEAFKAHDLTKPLTSWYENALDSYFEESQGPVKAEGETGTTKTPTQILVSQDKERKRIQSITKQLNVLDEDPTQPNIDLGNGFTAYRYKGNFVVIPSNKTFIYNQDNPPPSSMVFNSTNAIRKKYGVGTKLP